MPATEGSIAGSGSGRHVESSGRSKPAAKIIVGFDGSAPSHDALALGEALAAVEGGVLHVATALSYAPLPIEFEAYEQAEGEHFESIFDDARRHLAGTHFIPHPLRDASPARALDQLASSVDAETIVLGSSHRGRLGRIYPGSVAQRLLNGASCQIAIAPRGYAAQSRLADGVIGVGYDGSEEAELALRAAERLGAELNARVRLITVVPELRPLPTPVGTSPAAVAEALRESYREILERAAAGSGAEALLADGDPAAALLELSADLVLLVLGSRGYGPVRRTLLGSVSAAVVTGAPVPVLIVPRGVGTDSPDAERTPTDATTAATDGAS